MKKLIPIIFIIIVIVALFLSLSTKQNMTVVYLNNSEKKPIKIVLGKFQDSDCGMVIEDISYASQAIAPDGKTWFFHDHGAMAHWLKNKIFKDNAVLWSYTKDTKRWIDSRKAWFSLTDDTPMGYGFGAYEKKQNGFISYNEMFTKMARGENLTNPQIKAKLLGIKQ